jgi:hypothetical protein
MSTPKGPLAVVTEEQFASMLRATRGALPDTVAPGPFLEYGKDFDVGLDERARLAYDVFRDVVGGDTGDAMSFLTYENEYQWLVVRDRVVDVPMDDDDASGVTVSDMIEWFVKHRGVDISALREKFRVHNYGEFIRLLRQHRHVEMMPDALSGLCRPVVGVRELMAKISLFELLLHIRDPGVSRTHLMRDRYTAVSSHVPALFRDVHGHVHLYWSTPWPLGLVELPGDAVLRAPFSGNDVLVLVNSMFFSASTGDLVHFNMQGRVTRTCGSTRSTVTVKAADLVHAGLHGMSVEQIGALCTENTWETDHCPIFHYQHSAHTVRLTTKAENAGNRFFDGERSVRRTTYLEEDKIRKIVGNLSNPLCDRDSWYEGWVAHHSFGIANLAEMARKGQELSVPLVRVPGMWFHRYTSMMCRVTRSDSGDHSFRFAMPEDCALDARTAYPRINVRVNGTSKPVRVHLILYDSYQRYITEGSYSARPLVKRLEDGTYHVMVVDHVRPDKEPPEIAALRERMSIHFNQALRMTARAERLELVSLKENIRRAISHRFHVQVSPGESELLCSGTSELFVFLADTIKDPRVTYDGLRYWWENSCAGGHVAHAMKENRLTIRLNGSTVVDRGDASIEDVVSVKSALHDDRFVMHDDKDDRGGKIWVFVYFGSHYPRVTRFVRGTSACKALIKEHVSSKSHIDDCKTVFKQTLRLENPCVRVDACLFRPLNKTAEAERRWEDIGHVPLSTILQTTNSQLSMDKVVSHYAVALAKKRSGRCHETTDTLDACASKESVALVRGIPNGRQSLAGLRSQLLSMHREVNGDQWEEIKCKNASHTQTCASCLIHAIRLLPDGDDGGPIWSLEGYNREKSQHAQKAEKLETMIRHIRTCKGAILSAWDSDNLSGRRPGPNDATWTAIKNMIVRGGID